MSQTIRKNATPSFSEIDRAMRSVKALEQESPLLPETFEGYLARLVRLYASVQPVLAMLTVLPFIPPTWRAILKAFNDAVGAVVAGAGDIPANFKAGKDL